MDERVISKFNLFRNQVEKFVAFTDDEWLIFQQHLKLVSLKKKDFFVRAGEVCNDIGFIVSGSVRFYCMKNGEVITGYFSMENEMISSYKSFLTRQPGTTHVEAIENTELVSFSHHSLQQLLSDNRVCYKMERFGRLVSEYLICCYDDRVTSFIMQTAEERYIQLLTNGQNIIQRIPQHYIANYLGITPVSLSRIRKRIMEPAKQLQQILH